MTTERYETDTKRNEWKKSVVCRTVGREFGKHKMKQAGGKDKVSEVEEEEDYYYLLFM
jgi:hypothetical protein